MFSSSVDFAVDPERSDMSVTDAAMSWLEHSREKFSPITTFHFISHVAVKVCKDVEINNVMKTVIDKDAFRNVISKYFEHYICGESPDSGMEKLKQLNKPAYFCGRQFGVGDPTFTCRDCAVDQTCVFCDECFRKSTHVNHRYKLHASLGSGGCCDCGDVEAWKQDPACEFHSRSNPDLEMDDDPLGSFPEDVKHRTEQLFSYLLCYCVDMICWKYQGDSSSRILSTRNPLDATHHAVLFNDEVHTYDDVLLALTKAIGCDQQRALLLASIVDKEGRSIIYSGAYTRCDKICNEVRARSSTFGKKPLVCEVIHEDVLAHQRVALEVMEWVYQMISFSDGLRRILCQVVVTPTADRGASILEQVLLADSELWKVARSAFHQALMSGLMLDQFGKREFSITFAKKYKEMMRLFIKDDHDHSVSATAMSVQIFTAPTLARMLMTEHRLLSEIIECFVEHIQSSITAEGYINLQILKSSNSKLLKRTYFILHDLRYLLNQCPNEWTDQLRVSFLEAIETYLRLLKFMQNMDPVKRRLRTHIEYEPHWQDGYFLQLWLMPTLEAVLSWCASDRHVLLKTAEKAMTMLAELGGQNLTYVTMPGEEHRMVKFDIATEYTSVHMALSRFIAGLIPFAIRYNLLIPELLHLDNSMPLADRKLLLLEYSLRSLVLSAQVSAGMWTRNGFSLLNQVAYYQNVRCASEMYDRDIILLQTAATLLEPYHFLDILTYRYGLAEWLSPNFDESKLAEDVRRFTSSLVKEFFLTLLSVICERYVVGIGVVSSQDILRREVVHRLALGPSSRSELVKSLPCKEPDDAEHCSFESQLDGVLSEVADFRKPGVTGTGLYELKQEFYSHCAQFFYHYARNEHSKILEVWRKNSKKDNKAVVVTPPVPPCFTALFAPVTRLLTCQRLIMLIAVTLRKALLPKCDTISDTVVEEALYLICYGVYEEQRTTTAQIEHGAFASLIYKAKYPFEGGLLSVVDLLNELHHRQPEKEFSALLEWTISLIAESLGANFDVGNSRSGCSPKRKQPSNADNVGVEKQRRMRLAKEQRDKVMAQMSVMQKAFIASNSHFHDVQQQTGGSSMEVDAQLAPEDLTSVPVAVGHAKTNQLPTQKVVTCIVCQEEQEISAEGPPVVLTSIVQRSMVLSQASSSTANGNNKSDYDPLFLPADMFTGTHTNSCGHVMHGECWQKYVDGRQTLSFINRRLVDFDKNEYMCPLCGSLCNTVLPMLPKMTEHYETQHLPSGDAQTCSSALPDSLNKFIALVNQVAHDSNVVVAPMHQTPVLPERHPSRHRSFAHGVTHSLRSIMRRLVDRREDNTSTVESLLRQFASSVYTVALGASPPEMAPRRLTMSWSTCSYTIQALESYLSHDNKPLFGGLTSRQSECLESLVAYSHGSGTVLDPFQAERNALKLWHALSNSGNASLSSPSILSLNLFGTMVNLRFALPFLLVPSSCDNSGDFYAEMDHGVVRLFDVLVVVQALLCATDSEPDPNDSDGDCVFNPEEENPSVLSELSALWTRCQCLARNTCSVGPHPNPMALLRTVIRKRQTFLRCSALFFRFLTNVDAPLVLRDYVDPLPSQVERQVLASYLDLPLSPVALLRDVIDTVKPASPLQKLVDGLCLSPMTLSAMSSLAPQSQSPARRTLIDLPLDYSQCITLASGFRCPTSGDASRSPALCLLCGEMLCSQGFCCQTTVDGAQVGSCTAHTMRCGHGVGMFLQVRDCEILLLYNKTKGCFLPPPYLDEYGEADHGFRRGNPLFLSTERYKSLINTWLLHNIPETIARRQEKSKSLLAYHWADF